MQFKASPTVAKKVRQMSRLLKLLESGDRGTILERYHLHYVICRLNPFNHYVFNLQDLKTYTFAQIKINHNRTLKTITTVAKKNRNYFKPSLVFKKIDSLKNIITQIFQNSKLTTGKTSGGCYGRLYSNRDCKLG